MIIEDREFGEVIVRRNPLSRGERFRVSPSGRLTMSVPVGTSDFWIKRILNKNRDAIREALPLRDPKEQRARDYQKKMLAKKAREYLPYRLEYWAKRYGYTYDKYKLSHASTRWGSCTHRKRAGLVKDEITISLNIGLMQTPEVLRDYLPYYFPL